MYTRALRPLLFRLDAEDAHHVTLAGLRRAVRVPGALEALEALYGTPPSGVLASTVFGLSFASPIGLAAGLDKNAMSVEAWGRVGLGFLEVGTVTPRPQGGNPRPRLFRLPSDAALINRMGFNNDGADVVAERLTRLRERRVPLGVNIGKNKDTPNEEAELDYRACLRSLYAHGDFFVVNVSSPNTPGLRALQAGDELARLLRGVLNEADDLRVRHLLPAKPILVKIAPDLTDFELETTVSAAVSAGVGGFVVSNTTLSRDHLTHEKRGETGGLSGRPLRERSTALVRRVHRLTKGRVPIVGSGGVFTGRDAYDKIKAGASLVEVYTALVYEGPGLARRVNAELTALLSADGLTHVSQAVGVDA
ncbi:quinone-dependent dihydroorotate dehydrogenase [Deinococcus yavapaiensis]|uniref:quinone-dependent dihydroorotate dehydrogenase n=1 Tax=Deinococcus yavapaiensis TaxID=309889 RepID=UPI001B879554|nr:quinone-dependent dihydroorotate dehydrogenase [Deinococcus yavapaiensis]